MESLLWSGLRLRILVKVVTLYHREHILNQSCMIQLVPFHVPSSLKLMSLVEGGLGLGHKAHCQNLVVDIRGIGYLELWTLVL